MINEILGLHHITAIAGDPQQNYDFYTRVLGMRMVKRTVNFDDPKTYHLYYGDRIGSPGTILTFFPWPGVRKGKPGVGMATEIGYSVPRGSLDFWKQRLEKFGVNCGSVSQKFEEDYLPFQDYDGLNLELVVSGSGDDRQGNSHIEIDPKFAIKGFHHVSMNLWNIQPTAGVLTDIFGYKFSGQEKNRYRFKTSAVDSAAIVDLLETPDGERGVNAGGTNHHVAFRVKDEETLMFYRDKVLKSGLQITDKIDRDYFFSLYFREPGGVLFEIATDTPGFATDENVEELGSSLQLPQRYQAARKEIESGLPELKI